MKKILSMFIVVLLISVAFVGCSDDNQQNTNDPSVEENNEGNNENIEKVEEDTNKQEEQKDYILYLKDKMGPFLVTEVYSIDSNNPKLQEKSLKEIALNDLANFEGVKNLVSPLPEGTKILGLKEDGNTITVDLSKEFKENMWKDKQKINIAIDSIVNTLTYESTDKKVKLTVEGEKIDNINGVNMNQEFTFDEKYFMDK